MMRCPECGSKEIVRVVSGKVELTDELKRQLDAGEAVYLGDYRRRPERFQPDWECRNCRYRFYGWEDPLPTPEEHFPPEDLAWLKGVADATPPCDAEPSTKLAVATSRYSLANCMLSKRFWELERAANDRDPMALLDPDYVKVLVAGLEYGVACKADACALELGRLYLDGAGVPRDAAEAKRWLEEAERLCGAKAAEAIVLLGRIYELGLLGEPDYGKAFAEYAKAAGLGDADGLCSMADLVLAGHAGAPNRMLAFKLYGESRDRAKKWASGVAVQGRAALGMAELLGDPENAPRGMGYDPLEALRLFQEAEHCIAQSLADDSGDNREGLRRAIDGQRRLREAIAARLDIG